MILLAHLSILRPVDGVVDDRDTMRENSSKSLSNRLWLNVLLGLPMRHIEVFYVTFNCPVEEVINDINCEVFYPIIKIVKFKIDSLLVPTTICRDSIYIKTIYIVKVTVCVCACVCVCVFVCVCVCARKNGESDYNTTLPSEQIESQRP